MSAVIGDEFFLGSAAQVKISSLPLLVPKLSRAFFKQIDALFEKIVELEQATVHEARAERYSAAPIVLCTAEFQRGFRSNGDKKSRQIKRLERIPISNVCQLLRKFVLTQQGVKPCWVSHRQCRPRHVLIEFRSSSNLAASSNTNSLHNRCMHPQKNPAA